MKEHDWKPPSDVVNGDRGNIWSCRRCGACIAWNGWPGNPIDDPNYEVPPPPMKNSGGGGETRFSPYLENQLRDCDAEIVREIMET